MNIYSALQIGDYHINNCEDFLITKKIGTNKLLCAVMDGCSTAMESHFASVLTGKLLRKIAIEIGYKELYDTNREYQNIDLQLKVILESLFKDLLTTKNQLMLDEKELLTTLIILLYDSKENSGIILVIGDGLVSVNGKITEFENNNKPDYLAFHLNENFENWYNNQDQKILFNNLNDISIATDGILTFTQVKKTDIENKIDLFNYLLVDRSNMETEEMLNMKLKRLEYHNGLKPTDDLAIIRIIK